MMSAPESRIGIRRRGGRDTASRDTGATLPRARSSCNPSPDLLWRYIAHFLGGRRTPKIAICPWPCPTGVTSQHPLRQDPHRGTETLGATPRAYPGPRNERSPEEKPMIVRLHDVTKVAADHFRIALDHRPRPRALGGGGLRRPRGCPRWRPPHLPGARTARSRHRSVPARARRATRGHRVPAHVGDGSGRLSLLRSPLRGAHPVPLQRQRRGRCPAAGRMTVERRQIRWRGARRPRVAGPIRP